MPADGQLQNMTHIPGRLFSVSPATTRVVRGLFARNERVVANFKQPQGHMAMVLVGAIFVASIETVWAGEVTPPRGRKLRHWQYQGDEAITLDKGAEMGRFNMGSTVILLFPPGQVEWDKACQTGMRVQMGQRLGQIRG
jgi:phosphatidylserine decarboxylase